ncbi:hypothetical protein [Nostoc sp.]|uniref:hypothetical protein n=1 Tax=Nostoc sp. TaxID=1180 RepID=UPI002FFC4EF4
MRNSKFKKTTLRVLPRCDRTLYLYEGSRKTIYSSISTEMKNKLLALIAIGLILIGGIFYSPQSSSQALAQQSSVQLIYVGPDIGKKGRVQQVPKGIPVQFECQSASRYGFYEIFLGNKRVGKLAASTGSQSGLIPLEKPENLFTIKDELDTEVDSVLVKVK